MIKYNQYNSSSFNYLSTCSYTSYSQKVLNFRYFLAVASESFGPSTHGQWEICGQSVRKGIV